ncbi:efflux transporter outer membrane subunit [Cupriavidus plantarum]|uniref:Multidrug efflux system outer membrane protein n=1 Tax=Cupriavidus plantarum TaxID=942865 RepID=A0A316ESF4_9BURK|nr:efflux transporter outer membrane subunit [Cupriavidus plantarum]NYI01789.1 multidrug efflux system outer membrane protein [Cupriavidus plantarum]PWK33923.1 multidrug efflux system outer membrane protein [Cupriavidus plantarum]RLK33773.1 multidrug efflux system outer membrane protein [Cupriavidus plantarum]CAG2147719.1 Toluene efflux pump outer membrane protein TtgI [Cupriavidus plantarum]SMR85491.1 outer membrane protein, multidrug efflux system [Cupriavidus plantarum]
MIAQLTNQFPRLATLAAALVLAGCSLAPTYKVPETANTATFKEAEAAQAEGIQWKTATPADGQARGEWWKVFGDDDLNRLIDAANTSNQNLAAAAARVKQARAITGATEADLYPQLSVGVDPTRTQYSAASVSYLGAGTTPPIQTLVRARAIASYELDLFGRVASNVAAARAEGEAADDLFRSVQLALQADVAQAYFNLRTLDSDREILQATIKLREDALSLLRKRYDAGETTDLDPARAEAELGTARADLAATERRRANQEHALAVLTGLAPAQFALTPRPLQLTPLSVPAGLPSELLERRPDIAQAERQMAAANARIGVARAAFYPRISLSAFFGFESTNFADLFKYSSRAWAIGPLVGSTLAQTVFDGGRNSANLANARAAHEESVATYRQTVLTAFREVEDSLADVRWLSQQSTALDTAIAGAKRAQRISRSRYDAGAVDYLTVIDADRTVLQSQRDANTVAGLRASATVSLVRSLGGGWGPLPESVASNDGGKPAVVKTTASN